MKVVVTSPNYDEVTHYLHHYTQEIIGFANEEGISLSCLSRPRLTRDNFSKLIIKNSPLLILLNGHGNEKTVYGDKIKHEEEKLVIEGENHELLSCRLTYAVACSAGASLGKEVVKRGGCFIGYQRPFSFLFDHNSFSKPLKDRVAQPFLEPSNTISISLLKGKTAREAINKARQASLEKMKQLLKKKSEPGTGIAIRLLWNNMQSLVIHGEEEMKLS